MNRLVAPSALLVALSGLVFVACSDDDDKKSSTPLAISSVVPATGDPAGGESVTITGTGFTAASTVTLGGNGTTIVSRSTTQLVFNTPPGALGASTLAVTTGAETATATFTYTTAGAGTAGFQFIAGTDKWLLNVDIAPNADANANGTADLAEALAVARNDTGGTGFPDFESALSDLFSHTAQFYRNNPDGTLAAGGAPVSWRRTPPGVGASPPSRSIASPTSTDDYNEMALRAVAYVAAGEEQTGVVGRAISEVNTNDRLENNSGGTTGGGGADPVLGIFPDAIVFLWNNQGMPLASRTQTNFMEEVASVVAHECGHSMGLQHTTAAPPAPATHNLMAPTSTLVHTNIYDFDDASFTTFLGYMPGPSRSVHPSAWAPRRLLAVSDVVLVATPQRVAGSRLTLDVDRVLRGDVTPGALEVGSLKNGVPFDMTVGRCLVYLRATPGGLELASAEASLMPLAGKDEAEWWTLLTETSALEALTRGSSAWTAACARRLGRSLGSSDPRIRQEALVELAISRELTVALKANELARVVAILTAADASEAERFYAVQVLVHRGDATHAPALIEAGLAVDSQRLLELIGGALHDLCGAEFATAATRAALGLSPSPQRASRACALFGRMGDASTLDGLTGELQGAPRTARRAADALGQRRDPSSLRALQKAALDETREFGVRQRALRAIGRIGTPAAREWLNRQHRSAATGPWRDALRFARDYPRTWRLR